MALMSPKPDTSQPASTPRRKKKNLNLRIPVDLINRLEDRQAAMPGVLITDITVQALEDWCAWHEAQWQREHGEPLPERPSGDAGRMPRGRPWRHEVNVQVQPHSVMIDRELFERFYRVAYRQKSPGDYPARALSNALELWLQVHAP